MTGSGRSVASVVLATMLLAPPGRWIGSDKLKHFLLSAFVHGTGYSASRAAGAGRSASLRIGVAGATVAGLWKEVRDRRAGQGFSVADLVWDGAGAASMAALLRRAR